MLQSSIMDHVQKLVLNSIRTASIFLIQEHRFVNYHTSHVLLAVAINWNKELVSHGMIIQQCHLYSYIDDVDCIYEVLGWNNGYNKDSSFWKAIST